MKYFIGVKYKLELRGQIDATFRVKLNEAYPLKQVCSSDQKQQHYTGISQSSFFHLQRFEVPLVLVSEPELAPLTVLGQTADSVTLGLAESSAKVVPLMHT